jgi:Respiratory-chain NADH dehydrogenase 51 Kd subunit
MTTPTALNDLLGAPPGPVYWRGVPGLLIGELEAAGLTGRGGAGFPVARKLAAVVAAGRTPVVVGNGAEGEPASRKDLALLTRTPHLVLDGLQLAAEAVGADRAYLYVASGALATVRKAMRGRSDPVPVEVVTAAEHFVSGEETAVVAALDGRPALPGDTFRRVVDHGVGGRPTAVQNVETLAYLALIGRHGPEWFRSRGTQAEPGTALVTISGAVNHPGTDCRRWRTCCVASPPVTRVPSRSCTGSPGSRPGAAPATTPTARCGWSAGRCASSEEGFTGEHAAHRLDALRGPRWTRAPGRPGLPAHGPPPHGHLTASRRFVVVRKCALSPGCRASAVTRIRPWSMRTHPRHPPS